MRHPLRQPPTPSTLPPTQEGRSTDKPTVRDDAAAGRGRGRA
ncbi:hypothetical protein T261_04804 [Streptomyces lydicus]|nr:hypothetical protein T261_04804 [Streptomyces lydicus]